MLSFLSDSLLRHECIETYAKLRSSPARKKCWERLDEVRRCALRPGIASQFGGIVCDRLAQPGALYARRARQGTIYPLRVIS